MLKMLLNAETNSLLVIAKRVLVQIAQIYFFVFTVMCLLVRHVLVFQFNLAIKDYPDIDREANAAISKGLPNSNSSYVIEISLRTSDADALVLEVWSIAFINKYVAMIVVTVCSAWLGLE